MTSLRKIIFALITYLALSALAVLLRTLIGAPFLSGYWPAVAALGPIVFLGEIPVSDSVRVMPFLILYAIGSALFLIPFLINLRFKIVRGIYFGLIFSILWYGIGVASIIAISMG